MIQWSNPISNIFHSRSLTKVANPTSMLNIVVSGKNLCVFIFYIIKPTWAKLEHNNFFHLRLRKKSLLRFSSRWRQLLNITWEESSQTLLSVSQPTSMTLNGKPQKTLGPSREWMFASVFLGIEMADGIMTILIKRNSRIPTKVSKIFSASQLNMPVHSDNHLGREIKVYEGECLAQRTTTCWESSSCIFLILLVHQHTFIRQT